MRRTLLLIALISVAISSFAQEKKMLTPMDAAYQNRSIYPVGKNVNWLTGSDKYIFTESNNLMVLSLQVDSLPSDHQISPRMLEWVAYPFSKGSSQPRD